MLTEEPPPWEPEGWIKFLLVVILLLLTLVVCLVLAAAFGAGLPL